MSNLKRLPGAWIKIGDRAEKLPLPHNGITDREVLRMAGERLKQGYSLQLNYGRSPIVVERVYPSGDRRKWSVGVESC